MILADKIIYLRKKAGWSQEELAEKMEVSRQSISKWEGALSVPDMNRILKLSELFDVSTDYLLRDEMEEEDYKVPICMGGVLNQNTAEGTTPVEVSGELEEMGIAVVTDLWLLPERAAAAKEHFCR